MIKTSDVVKNLYLQSDTAQLAAREGILNVSAFAQQIHAQVEELTMKSVEVATIRTALYRLLENLHREQPLKPTVKIEKITQSSSISTLTYVTQPTLYKKLGLVLPLADEHHFLTVTQGITELTIIASAPLVPDIINILGEPDTSYSNLAAITVSFDKKYLAIPNMIYTLFSSLAVQHINVIEIVSTLTNLTFVVERTDAQKTVTALEKHFRF